MNVDSLSRVALEDWGVMRLTGADAVTFLQGQLSNDMSRLVGDTSVLAGYHNPQGRAIALLRLVRSGSGDVLAVLPRELIPDVMTRLRKFILRAKVAVTDASNDFRVIGLSAASEPVRKATSEDLSWIRVEGPDDRWIVVAPSEALAAFADYAEEERASWAQRDVEMGIPQIYTATSEAFVAQMLNLDVLNGIAFDKGCYTGQEVIARAHYRGRVKRRLQRFRSVGAVTLARGDSGQLSDGRTFKVVEAIALPDGRCEFLAVAATSVANEEPAESPTQAISAEGLPLPYPLPE